MTTAWTHLAMLNFEIDPAVLEPHVPTGTLLDTYQGRALVSVVAFRFNDTRVLGIGLPWHRNFAEINLRFYVRRLAHGSWRRGVVFIKEIVKLPLVAWTARLLYDENFVVLPVRYGGDSRSLRYKWKFRGAWQQLALQTTGEPQWPTPGSEVEFVVNHNWGYTALGDGTTAEYRVDHPPWRVWNVTDSHFHCDVAGLYGDQFAAALSGKPSSVTLVEGSPVAVYRGKRLTATLPPQEHPASPLPQLDPLAATR